MCTVLKAAMSSRRKSARSYDDERRRVESWLGDYMRFRQTADGKKVFLSIDSRISHHNPLYKAWKAKSFTDGDITLHFLIFDVLSGPDIALPLSGIMDEIDRKIDTSDDNILLMELIKDGDNDNRER